MTTMHTLRWLGICVLLALAQPIRGADAPTGKVETKQRNRWSIADWLEQRDKMRLQDMWLAMHSPSPYEFYGAVAYKTGALGTGGAYQGWNFGFAAYAYMFGAELQYQTSNVDTRWFAMANLRLFGYHNQATNFTVQAGVRNEIGSGTNFWNPLVGANFTLYIAKPAGVVVLYRYVFARSVGGLATPSHRIEAGGFIDFQIVRLHVDYFYQDTLSDALRSSRGVQVGGRVYF